MVEWWSGGDIQYYRPIRPRVTYSLFFQIEPTLVQLGLVQELPSELLAS